VPRQSFLGVAHHGAELEAAERPLVEADALLHEDHRPSHRDQDKKRNGEHQGRHDDNGADGDGNVETALPDTADGTGEAGLLWMVEAPFRWRSAAPERDCFRCIVRGGGLESASGGHAGRGYAKVFHVIARRGAMNAQSGIAF
jgi:hypothetical protein